MAHRWGPALAGCVVLSTAAVADENCAEDAAPPIEVTVSGSLMSDYIYRGVTLSAHRPAVSNEIKARFGDFYVSGAVSSVSLPTAPTAEIALSGGYARKFGRLCIDVGAVYFHYPKEMLGGLPTDTDYWEAHLGGTYHVLGDLSLNAQFAWSPNISKTGAWSRYAEVGFEYELPKRIMPHDVEAKISAGVGRYWFGAVMPELGDFRLPAYTYWHVGIELEFEPFTLDLRYHNTNLSKENCFVFTGDPNATPGGIVNEASNPDGLRSKWCGAAVVATLTFTLDYPLKK